MEDLRIDASRLAELCRRYGIARLEVFGSVARGEQRPDSDVDLLYTLEGGRALGWEVEDLVESLTEVFHRPVDLVSRRSLHPMIRDRVMAEAETLYAAARVPGRCGHLSGRLGGVAHWRAALPRLDSEFSSRFRGSHESATLQ